MTGCAAAWVTSPAILASGDPISDFFEGLASRGHEPLLEKMKGSVAVEVTDSGEQQRWLVNVNGGDMSVERGGGDADCALRASRDLISRLVTGQANALASILRGGLAIEGDLELLALFQRVLPALSGAGAQAHSGAGSPSS